MKRKKVLLVDDHPFILNGVSQILSNIENLDIIDTSKNGKEALNCFR